jgi:hypothetical protein
MSMTRFNAKGVSAKRTVGGKKSSIDGGLKPELPVLSAATYGIKLERADVSRAYS